MVKSFITLAQGKFRRGLWLAAVITALVLSGLCIRESIDGKFEGIVFWQICKSIEIKLKPTKRPWASSPARANFKKIMV